MLRGVIRMRKYTPAIAAMLCVIAACNQPVSEQKTPGLTDRLQSVQDRIDAAEAAGASGVLRISVGGEVLYQEGFGSAACNRDEPVTAAYVFMIGSITKEVTQLLGYILEERGFLSLDDTLGERLPEFSGPIADITLRQVMEHTAGLPDLIDANGDPVPYNVEYDYLPVTRAELIERAGRVEPLYAPGSSEQYSNLGYQLLAAVYEIATDQAFPELVNRYVAGPAKLDVFGFTFPDAQNLEFADGCRSGDVHWGNPVDEGMWDANGPSWNLMGAGGLLADAESLAGFFEGIAAGVYFDDPAQSERYMDGRMVYSEARRQLVMGPAGSNGIFNAVAFWANSDRLSVILMTNRADHLAEAGLFRDLMRLLPPEAFADHE